MLVIYPIKQIVFEKSKVFIYTVNKVVFNTIYLDNAATTRISQEAESAISEYNRNKFGNPGSLYSIGRAAKTEVLGWRSMVAKFLGCNADQIIFTSGGTESNNMVLLGVAEHLRRIGKTHIVSDLTEHDSVIRPLKFLEKNGFSVTYLSPEVDGTIREDVVRSAINENTGLVSIMYVNNETGAENPVDVIGEICAKKGVLFHTDCVQAAGSVPIDVEEIGCDFATISSHKIHGPMGIGCIYARDKSKLFPIIHGGADQEFGLRGGTENVPAIVGFGTACQLASAHLREHGTYMSMLKQLFFTSLENALKAYGLQDKLHVNGAPVIRRGKTLNIRFDDIDGETLILMLDACGICVSAGSACRSHESEPSRVLLAMGIAPDDARNSIRVSFSWTNTEAEVVSAAYKIAECVGILCSPGKGWSDVAG